MKSMLSEALCEIRGLLDQLLKVLAGDNGEEWLMEFKKFLRKEECWTKIEVKVKKYLNLISAGENLIIDACDEPEIIAGSDNIFEAGIDSDFVNWGADEPGESTSETSVEVYEMIENGTYTQIFGSLSRDVEKLCLTQAQIKNFVVKHKQWLRQDGYATFFLFKSKGHFFVANVYVDSDGELYVFVYRFVDDFAWYAGRRHRIVVPQLA